MTEPFDLSAAAFNAVHEWWKAWVERDAGAIQRMAAPDYTERNDLGRLQLLGAARLPEILSREPAHCDITEWKLSDPVTRRFERVVVCSYSFQLSGTRGHQRFVYRGRATDVLTRDGDGWLIVSHEGLLEGGRLVG